MTIKLYDENAYATEFEAKVLEVNKKDESYELVLDKTMFFPEEGGQSCDMGSINGCMVKHVRIKDNVIYHLVDKEF